MTRRDDRRRRLNPDEAHLWRKVAASVTPLSPATAKPVPKISHPKQPLKKATAKAAHKPTKMKPPAKPAHPCAPGHRPAQIRSEPPPLTGLDRSLSRRLARGRVEIDARLDLHGHRRDAAHEALHVFLADARARGARCVLIITGKGQGPTGHTLHGHRHYHTPERTTILRTQVPLWLEEAAARVHVAGYQPAHPRHGGGGAFYVWLRRQR